MSRELKRRLGALEAAREGRGVRHVVSDRLEEQDVVAQSEIMTEVDWEARHCRPDEERRKSVVEDQTAMPSFG